MLIKKTEEKLMPFLRKNAFLLIAGCLAAVLLLFFGNSFSKNNVEKEDKTVKVTYDEKEYVDQQEKKLKDILSGIEGVGKCNVMIVVNCGYEYVYAQDSTDNSTGDSKSYKILDSSDGDSALLLKRESPQVSGVAVVCQGAGSTAIKNAIIEIVSKSFNISGANISVEKMQ